jgi:hypothetical protein
VTGAARVPFHAEQAPSPGRPETPASDEEEAYARRAVRRSLTSVDAVAHARAAGTLAARPSRQRRRFAPRRCFCLKAAVSKNGDRPSASSRPPRGLCATRPPWRFVACLPADFTEVGQCVSPSPTSPSVLPEATTKLVRHARPPSLQSQPTPVVIACPCEEAEQRWAVRGGGRPMDQRAPPVAKSPSGGDLPGLERHVVAERLELADEASGEAVGVLAGEVVAAQVAV